MIQTHMLKLDPPYQIIHAGGEVGPYEFTLEDAKRVRRQQGLSANDRDTAHMIRTWKARGYCAQSTVLRRALRSNESPGDNSLRAIFV